MKKNVRIAALGISLLLAASAAFACGDNGQTAEAYTIIKESTDKALSIESGEILIYEMNTADKDFEGYALNKSSETYIRFTGTEDPDFNLSATITAVDAGQADTYELIKDGENVLELTNGEGAFIEDAVLPDIFELFRLEYDVKDIKSVEVVWLEKGIQLYSLTMNSQYANKFDITEDDMTTDCTDVVLSYYINSVKELQKVVCEYTSTVTVNGESVKVVKAIDAQIA